MRARWRWSSPGGASRGMARATREEAMVEGVGAATGRSARSLDAGEVLALWLEAEARGWSIEELRP